MTSKKKNRKKAAPRPKPSSDKAKASGKKPAASLLLSRARSMWQAADWDALASIPLSEIKNDKNRAQISLLMAAAQTHVGCLDAARDSVRQALAWGVSRDRAARVMMSAAQNSLGRVATALEDKSAPSHFQEAMRLVEPDADVRLSGRTRQIREAARLGLLPDALIALETNLHSLEETPQDASNQLSILKTELDLLKHELMISLKRGQIYGRDKRPDRELSRSGADLEAKAVSQLGQELWVLERVDYKRDGFFVEFGATDGITLSNSWLLEHEFGWSGICAEPNPKFFKDLQANRSCVVSDECIGQHSGDRISFILADVYGGIADYSDADNHAQKRAAYKAKGEILEMTTISLEDFLLKHDAPREIDYLSIDTEGSEYDILASFPFDQWTIRLITVEHNFTPMREDIYALLVSHGYQRTEAQWDDWYELSR